VIGVVIGVLVATVAVLAGVVIAGRGDPSGDVASGVVQPSTTATTVPPATATTVPVTLPPTVPRQTTVAPRPSYRPAPAPASPSGTRCPSDVYSASGDSSMSVVNVFITDNFTVTICSGSEGYWYHGRDNADASRTKTLPADSVSGGYVAASESGTVVYEIDRGRLVVTEGGEVLVSEVVHTTR
jgi:hypothetical protein